MTLMMLSAFSCAAMALRRLARWPLTTTVAAAWPSSCACAWLAPPKAAMTARARAVRRSGEGKEVCMVFMVDSVREEGTGRILGSKYDGCVTDKFLPS